MFAKSNAIIKPVDQKMSPVPVLNLTGMFITKNKSNMHYLEQAQSILSDTSLPNYWKEGKRMKLCHQITKTNTS
mgnify:CR=1 FL=1